MTLTGPTAELAVGLIIGVMRHLAEADQNVRGGGFAGWRPLFYGSALPGATVGIAGMGRVGQAAAARLRAVPVKVIMEFGWAGIG